ncbi:MAG TPA: SEC-C metal-binding domain-containing protein, partial [Vicinamibacterales bacterium]|nr:SEC-C metal-binding domain-containing protein [Vicinamibacterales bacterium]
IRLSEDEVVDTREYLMSLAEELLDSMIETYAAKTADYDSWDLEALKVEVNRVFAIDAAALDFANQTSDEIRDLLWDRILESYLEKEKLVGREILGRVERDLMLQIVDAQWKDHLYSLDHLKEGIGLRGYGQRDPLVEYKKESFSLFTAMKERVEEEIVRYLWWLRPVLNEGGDAAAQPVRRPRAQTPLIMGRGAEEVPPAFAAPRAEAMPDALPPRGQQPPRVGGDDVVKTVRRDEPKVGRNDPCPCGSGKKYKKCHGAAA